MRSSMSLVDLIADYTVLHLTAEHRHDLAEFVEAYIYMIENPLQDVSSVIELKPGHKCLLIEVPEVQS